MLAGLLPSRLPSRLSSRPAIYASCSVRTLHHRLNWRATVLALGSHASFLFPKPLYFVNVLLSRAIEVYMAGYLVVTVPRYVECWVLDRSGWRLEMKYGSMRAARFPLPSTRQAFVIVTCTEQQPASFFMFLSCGGHNATLFLHVFDNTIPMSIEIETITSVLHSPVTSVATRLRGKNKQPAGYSECCRPPMRTASLTQLQTQAVSNITFSHPSNYCPIVASSCRIHSHITQFICTNSGSGMPIRGGASLALRWSCQ